MEIVIAGRGRPYLDGESVDHGVPLAITVPAIYSPAECAAMVARIDALNPAAAPVTTNRGFQMMPDIRNNERVMFDDGELARELYARLDDALPRMICGVTKLAVNERFRCYRYQPGQRFAPHQDGAFRRSPTEQSQLTLMVYLNDGFGGGTTKFLDFDREVVPRAGDALLFQHRLWHEGCVVTSGVKYVLRSDVMYREAQVAGTRTIA